MNSREVHKIWIEQCEERSLCGKSPAQSEQWYCWIGRRRIILASAENRGIPASAWVAAHSIWVFLGMRFGSSPWWALDPPASDLSYLDFIEGVYRTYLKTCLVMLFGMKCSSRYSL
jgi:hypothetical protein